VAEEKRGRGRGQKEQHQGLEELPGQAAQGTGPAWRAQGVFAEPAAARRDRVPVEAGSWIDVQGGEDGVGGQGMGGGHGRQGRR